MATEVLKVPGRDCLTDSGTSAANVYLNTVLSLLNEALCGDGENDDAIMDEAERMAAAGETGPVMLNVDPPDMEAIEAKALAAFDAEVERDPEGHHRALEARRERHRRHDRMVERAHYVAPAFLRAAPERRRPRKQRHGTRRRVTRGSPGDEPPPHEPDRPCHPRVYAESIGDGRLWLAVVDGALGYQLGETEVPLDPFHPGTRRAIRWLARQTGADPRDVRRAVWTAWVQGLAA
jgi:hypothetical protein